MKPLCLSFVVGLLLVVACTKSPVRIVDESDWLGKWQGPEGTSVELSVTGDGYRIVVTNLDGPRTFTGRAVASDRIQFDRDGTTESIRRGSGKDTGMKWLAD